MSQSFSKTGIKAVQVAMGSIQWCLILMNQFEQRVIKSAYKMMHIARIIKRNASLLQGSVVLHKRHLQRLWVYRDMKSTEANESIY